MDLAPVLERILGDRRVARIMAILDTFGKAPGGLLANGLAFSTLFASIPTLLLALGLAGIIADEATVRKITDALIKAVPPLTDIIESSVVAVSQGAAITGLIGLVGVIWTVSQLYVTLDVAFSRIFAATPERDIFRRTARGFIWVAILAALIIGLIVLASVATALDALLPGTFPFAGTIVRVVGSEWFLLVATIAGVGLLYRRHAAPCAGVADPGAARLRGRPRDVVPDPGIHVPGAAPRRGGRTRRLAGDRVHRAGLAVIPLPGAALRRGLGQDP